MFSGAAGFGNAPVCRLLCAVTVLVTISVILTNSRNKFNLDMRAFTELEVWRLFTNVWFVTSPPELILSLVLLYFARTFERMMGSIKFVVLILVSFLIGLFTQIAAITLFSRYQLVLENGPATLLYSFAVLYYYEVPVAYHFRFLSIPLHDKYFVYLLFAQLCLYGLPGSIVSAIGGISACMVYRSHIFGLSEYEPPALLTRCFDGIISLLNPAPPPVALPVPPPPTAAVPVPSPQPPVPSAAAAANSAPPVPRIPQPDQASIDALTSMGFDESTAKAALQHCNNDLHMATNMLLDKD
ncbi:Rhomboid protein 20 [Pelomyxa schiedti]|nr:Rhomboid protein 20 [Pelomyxa schiedti]